MRISSRHSIYNQRVKFTQVCFNRIVTANIKAQPEMSRNVSAVQDRRKFSTDPLLEIDAAESIGDIRNDLERHPADVTTYCRKR
jgi:hypothetical protein